MKKHAWLLKTPLILLFSLAFYWSVQGERGELESALIRDNVYPALVSLKGWFTNLKFNVRGPVQPKNKIIIIAIDEASINNPKFGKWPWHRDKISDILLKVFSYGAKSVGLDIVFSEQDQRVPDAVRQVLTEVKKEELIPTFETDNQLADIISDKAGMRKEFNQELVLGWMSEKICKPAYISDCLATSIEDQAVNPYPENFERFKASRINGLEKFDPKKTPISTGRNILANIPLFRNAAQHMGNFDIKPDPDAYIRNTSLITIVDGKPHPSLALELARLSFLKKDRDGKIMHDEVTKQYTSEPKELEVAFGAKNLLQSISFAGYRPIHTSPLGVMEINFRGGSHMFPYISAGYLIDEDFNSNNEIRFDVDSYFDLKTLYSEAEKYKDKNGFPKTSLDGYPAFTIPKTSLFKDAIVLIGVTAKGLYDMRAFPFDPNVAGVEGHANIIDNLLSGDELISSSDNSGWIILLAMMTLGALGFALFIQKVDAVPGLITFLLSAGAFAVVDQKLLFERLQNWNTSLLYLEFASLFFVTLALKYVLEERNKKFIKGAFSKYVAPAIVDSILKDPSKLTVGGEKREMTIMFSDIRGFTTFSEKMDAKALSNFLNDYLSLMTNLVFEHQGTLDKYIGDAVMAFWGAPVAQPGHALNACKATLQMIQTLKEHQPRFKSQYDVDVQIGIGLNSGTVSVGNMGSERIFEYTVIGDSVNLASRTEGLTKAYGVTILTTRFTLDCIQKSGETLPPHRALDLVKVKGKNEAIELVQLLDRPLPTEGLILFEEARRLYTQQKWDDAILKFKTANEILRSPLGEPDGPCQEFVARCEEFRQNPPDADWDGSWKMTSK